MIGGLMGIRDWIILLTVLEVKLTAYALMYYVYKLKKSVEAKVQTTGYTYIPSDIPEFSEPPKPLSPEEIKQQLDEMINGDFE